MNRTGRQIDGIVIHCSAGYGDINSQRAHWKSLGWKSAGYHTEVDLQGDLIEVTPFMLIANGVAGHNSTKIHICYTGGVQKNNVNKAKDSRTKEQKAGLITAINQALTWIDATGGDVSKITIKGHRDYSKDLDGDGKIEEHEWIKVCPSFDAEPEYAHLIQEFLDKKNAGTPITKVPVKRDVTYFVRRGDSLWSIAKVNRITIEQLKALNPGVDAMLQIGDELRIA
jgi:N-acetylmuramoyl-L-alanine amidase